MFFLKVWRDPRRLLMSAILAAAIAFYCIVCVSLAFAADAVASTNSVPWGDWLVSFITAPNVTAALVTIIAGLIGKATPPAFRAFITPDRISAAVSYALAAGADAARGKTLDIPTINSTLDLAEKWIIANEPKIAAQLGGALRPWLLAEIGQQAAVPPEAVVGVPGASRIAKINAPLPDPITQ